jgi:broad specificity phosphatase PhoE
MKCYFIRHGEAVYNTLGLCNAEPTTTNPLTAAGVRQAREAAMRLAGASPELIFTSELPRAQQTAGVIASFHPAPIRTDARLNDRKSGFEKRPVKAYLAAAAGDPVHFKYGDGESYLEQKVRVLAFLEDLRQYHARAVLVVTHHEVLQIVNGHFRQLQDIEMWRTWIDHGQVLAFDF